MKKRLIRNKIFYYFYKLLKIYRNKKPSIHYGEFGEDILVNRILNLYLLVMSEDKALELGLKPLAYFRGFTTMGCEPDEMGIGPVFSVPKLLKSNNMSVEDIDLWELNEAFAVQVAYCRNQLGIPMDKLNVNGGSISIGHPFGMTGSRQVGHIVRELQNQDKQFGIVTMCVGGGMGASGLFERYPS